MIPNGFPKGINQNPPQGLQLRLSDNIGSVKPVGIDTNGKLFQICKPTFGEGELKSVNNSNYPYGFTTNGKEYLSRIVRISENLYMYLSSSDVYLISVNYDGITLQSQSTPLPLNQGAQNLELIAPNKVALTAYNGTDTKLVIGTVSGMSTTWGTPVTIGSGSISNRMACLSDNTFVFVKETAQTACIVTVSGTVPTLGTFYAHATIDATYSYSVCKVSATSFCILASYVSLRTIIGTVSGTTISYGSTQTFSMTSGIYDAPCKYVQDGKIFIAANFGSPTNGFYFYLATISGSTVSLGTPIIDTNHSGNIGSIHITADCTKIAVSTNGSSFLYRFDFNGTTLTLKDHVDLPMGIYSSFYWGPTHSDYLVWASTTIKTYYSLIPLSYADTAANYAGILQSGGRIGSMGKMITKGYVYGFRNLKPELYYYLNQTNGAIETTVSTKLLGVAVTPSILLLF